MSSLAETDNQNGATSFRAEADSLKKGSRVRRKKIRLKEGKRYNPDRIRVELSHSLQSQRLEPTAGCVNVLNDSTVPELMGQVRDFLAEEWENYAYHYTWTQRVGLSLPKFVNIQPFFCLGEPDDQPAVALLVVSDSYLTPRAKRRIPDCMKFQMGSNEYESLCSVYVEEREGEFFAVGRVFSSKLDEIPVEDGWEAKLQTAIAEKLDFI